MLQVGFAVENVRHAKKRQIHGHAAHDVAHCQIGSGVYRRAQRRGEVGQRGHSRQQQDPEERLAQAGSVGQGISLLGQPAARDDDHQGRDAKGDHAGNQG